VEGGFIHGIDLVRHIREQFGDYFDIAVAGFPQHQDLPPEELAQELQWLKEKTDAGANFIFTQMFYDVDVFIAWVKSVRAAGITVPIVPGIAPIQTWNGFIKSTSLSGTTIPEALLKQLEPHKNNDEKVREIGIQLVADMCRRILREDIGIRGLHFYTMNLEKGTRMLLEELQLVPRVEVVKPMPWRQVCFILSELPAHALTLFPVPHTQPSHGDHPPHLLGQPYKVISVAHRKLGRVPEWSFR
jgi:methylenetetrahydrofolate reductase (NADPH)